MPTLNISLNLDEHPWNDLGHADLPHNPPDQHMPVLSRIGLLPEGMVGGRASVVVCIDMPDGSKILAETSLRNFRLAAGAILGTPIAIAEDEFGGTTILVNPDDGTGEILLP